MRIPVTRKREKNNQALFFVTKRCFQQNIKKPPLSNISTIQNSEKEKKMGQFGAYGDKQTTRQKPRKESLQKNGRKTFGEGRW
jgi:hypothetical protein